MSDVITVKVKDLVFEPAGSDLDLRDPLYRDMRKHGMRRPIIIDFENRVIDGRRRLHFFRGDSEVEAVQASRYEEVFDLLVEARDEQQAPFTPARIYRMH